jgi:hypothetical protein
MATPTLELDELEDLDDELDLEGENLAGDENDEDQGASESRDAARERAAFERKKANEFRFAKLYPGGCDKNTATTYAEEHFTEILKGAALPGLRRQILHELFPLGLTHKVRRELGFTWQIDQPLPSFAPVQQIRTIIGLIRGFPLLTGFEFIGVPANQPGAVDLTLRLHGQERRMQVTQKAFDELDSPMGAWCTLMGEHTATARRRKSVNATARDFSMPYAA